jgi:capsular exopolysaccharide synthesis family protein
LTEDSRNSQEWGANGGVSDGLVTFLDPEGLAAEAFRTLRTNLIYALVDEPPEVIVVTSANPQEGKSTVCANLGVVLAQAERKTLILDCDLRRPSLHDIFGLRNMRGLVDVVAGGREPGGVWQEPLANLKLITSGPIPPNPTELLGSKRFSEFLSGIRREFDYVLLDAPPVGLVSDPSILASQGDGVLLVLDAQKTRKAVLRQSRRSLEAVGAKVFGTVMSNVGGSTGGYYSKQAYK